MWDRCGIAWSWSAVGAILANPRYTGQQVWNKQPKSEVLIDVNDVGLGHTTKQSWNDADKWIWSERPVHEPLVLADDLMADHVPSVRARLHVGQSRAQRVRHTWSHSLTPRRKVARRDQWPRCRRLHRRAARVILAGGASGSGWLASQRRKRNARSLVVADPKSAVAMMIIATAASQMTMTRPTSGCE